MKTNPNSTTFFLLFLVLIVVLGQYHIQCFHQKDLLLLCHKTHNYKILQRKSTTKNVEKLKDHCKLQPLNEADMGENDVTNDSELLVDRRKVLGVISLSLTSCLLPKPSKASGLLSFPPRAPLNNRYYAVRSGESEADAAGLVATNPAYKLNVSNGLTSNGVIQAEDAAARLEILGVEGSLCFVWYSTTARSTQTATRIGELLGIGRERMVPEFTFLDARGLGAFDGGNLSDALLDVYAGDKVNPDYKPPENTDGTLSESLNDIFVRVRQVISITETQYLGEDIIFITPDSDTLSVLQAALTGTDLTNHQKYSFKHGEVRLIEPFINCVTKNLPMLC